MYRVLLSGNRYRTNQEVGLHYQIHRGIGVHHAAAVRRGERLKVNVHVGGPPSLIFSAVMPLPENLSELTFAGALGNRRVRLLARTGGLPLLADADFAICGEVLAGELLPEGPFGDHLGYYSLRHDFPVLRVQKVFHRDDAIWPFTVVGRPPQEDTVFGELIHQLVGPVLSSVLPGVHAVHAVDAAGVHPLLLAIGSERYSPYVPVDRPQEVLTQASAILGHGQMSLAKYLWIASRGDDEQLDVHDVARFLTHVLCRVDWSRDLHFHTCTTIDTLDYSGTGLNQGSKVVIAGVGPPRRTLPERIADPWTWPEGFHDPRVVLPGVVVVNGPPCRTPDSRQPVMDRFCAAWNSGAPINAFPLVVVVDDSAFAAASLRNFLWVSFTRSDPAIDLYGIEAFIRDKHWGCRGALVLDARIKPHHAPPLVEDPAVTKRVDALGAPGGPLHGII
jgi:4-hydroxy-3-polyprenylbenzoate decarboxylase